MDHVSSIHPALYFKVFSIMYLIFQPHHTVSNFCAKTRHLCLPAISIHLQQLVKILPCHDAKYVYKMAQLLSQAQQKSQGFKYPLVKIHVNPCKV